jgi:hypothetical protein
MTMGSLRCAALFLLLVALHAPVAHAEAGPFDPDKPLYLGALFAVGLGLVVAGAWLVWRERALGAASLNWPTAPGIIKSSKVATHDADGIEMYVAQVTYDYNVRGKTYVGDHLRFDAFAGSREKAQQDVDNYRAGMPVEVRYAPQQPQTSILEPGGASVSSAGLALVGGGAALLVLAIAVAIFV